MVVRSNLWSSLFSNWHRQVWMAPKGNSQVNYVTRTSVSQSAGEDLWLSLPLGCGLWWLAFEVDSKRSEVWAKCKCGEMGRSLTLTLQTLTWRAHLEQQAQTPNGFSMISTVKKTVNQLTTKHELFLTKNMSPNWEIDLIFYFIVISPTSTAHTRESTRPTQAHRRQACAKQILTTIP